MATLLIKSGGFEGRVLKLKLGTNRLGRSHENDFQIEHPTISSRHCEIDIAGDCLVVRDCNSTNGTFIDGERVSTGTLNFGGVLRLGDVELVAESISFEVAIPRFHEPPASAPPVILPDGSLTCPRHSRTISTYRCLHCRAIMCNDCVKRLRVRGGRLHYLCCKCSHHCEGIGASTRKRKSLLAFLRKTVKLPFTSGRQTAELNGRN